MSFSHDDYAAARAQAKRENKLLFVDAWAEWCHTCISMKHYVFTEPALAPLESRVVFLALDTDREANAAFLEKFPVHVWPSLFAIDPDSENLMGFWPGSASLTELRGFLNDSLLALEQLNNSELPRDSPLHLMVRAKSAQNEGNPQQAEALFEKALDRAPGDWPRRSEAMYGRLQALASAGRIAECAGFGAKVLLKVQGAALPADFASLLLSCSSRHPNVQERARVRRAVINRLEKLLEKPASDMAPDDVADALAILAEAEEDEGQVTKARRTRERGLEVMERAADAAKTPRMAATYDYQRANAYFALGRGNEAIELLEKRMAELPDSYEPPARLASILERMGEPARALEALEKALAHAYGPRRLAYLAQKARLCQALGRSAEQIEALEQEVQGYRELRDGQRNRARRRDAEQRLEAARKRQPN